MNLSSQYQHVKAVVAVQTMKFMVDNSARAKGFKLLAVALVMAVVAQPGTSFADNGAPWQSALDSVLKMMTGPLGRTIAALAVVSMGIMAMVGKLAWETAIKLIIGIVMIVSAVQIVDWVANASGGSSGG